MPQRANIQIDFSGGTDQRTDARHVVPGRVSSLLNATFEKAGSIRKRRGFTALSRAIVTGGSLAAAVRLGTFGNDLVLSDGDSLYSFASAAGKWAYKDQLPQCSVTRTPVTHGSSTFLSPSVAYGNGYLIFAWLQNYDSSTGYGSVYTTVVDLNGGQVLSNIGIETTQSSTYPRVVVIGTKALLLYGDNAGQINACTLDLTNPTAFSAPTILVTDMTPAHDLWDACAMSDRFAIVYRNLATGASPKINVKTFAATLGAALASRTLPDTVNPTSFAFACRGTTGETLWIGYEHLIAGTLTVKLEGLNPSTLADTTTAFTIASVASSGAFPIGIERISSTDVLVTWAEQDVATNILSAKWRRATTAGALLGVRASYLRRHLWLSRPFAQGGRVYAMSIYAQDLFTSSANAFLLDLNAGDTTSQDVLPRPVSTIAPRRCSTSPISDVAASLCDVPVVSSTMLATASVVRKSAAGKLGIDWTAIDFANASRHTPSELGGSLHLSGGVPCIYDGARVIENAALLTPESPTGFTQASGSGALSIGTYNYCITYARYDTQGQRQRSAPSAAFSYPVTANLTTTTFKVVPLGLTLLQDIESKFLPNWIIEVWRTVGGGSTFFRVPDAYLTSGTVGPVLNDPKQLTQTISDTCGDGTLQTQEILYTTGGTLENRCPPSATINVIHKDRAWLAGTDDPKVLWFSQPYTFGEAPGFHDSNTITVEEGGAITALASLDSHLIVFKRDRMFVIDGDGPGATGGPGFSAPQRVAVDLGCINPNSVAVVPDGVVFQSTAGIYLLDRGLQVTYLSGPVTDTLAANPTITGAVVHESQFQIRFTCNGGATGVVLVFDYLAKQWSTFQLYDATAALASTAVASAVNHAGVYKWVAPNGTAYGESPTLYTDAGQWVTMSVETAWLKVGGLQGWQRAWSVQTLSERFSAHDLKVEIATDYAAAYPQSTTWSDAAIAAMPLEQVRTAVQQQKCQAIRFRVSDATPTGGAAVGSGQGGALTGLLLEAALLGKAKRLPAAQRG